MYTSLLTSLTTSIGVKPSFRPVSLSRAVKAGMEKATTTLAPDARSAATCGAMLVLVST